jgi:hypothetical protein
VVSQNSFINNKNYGVAVSSTSTKIRITENDFLINSFSPQALDRGSDNIFAENYWNPWEISDEGYLIDGEAENWDFTPAGVPNRPVPDWLELEENPRLERTLASTSFMSTSIMVILLAYIASLLILDSRERTIIINLR